MKQLILEEEMQTKSIDSLSHISRFYAGYKTNNYTAYLTRVNGEWGFLYIQPIHNSGKQRLSFCSTSAKKSLDKAVRDNKKVITTENFNDFILWIHS